MTKINRLTQLTTLEDSDLSVVWQDSSERTRAITIENLRKFIQSTDPNADAFVKAELVGDELILTSHDETETKVDINILPQHSVTELNDMPDNLISGHYLKVNDEGNAFTLTQASEISAAVITQEDGNLKGLANVLNFEGFSVEVSNRIAKISNAPLNATDGEIMKVEGGKLVPSGVVSNKDGSISLSSGSVDIGPHTISSSGEGIEATNDSTSESYSFVFAGQGDDCGPVDRIFSDESTIKTTEDLSLELTNHVSKLTATADIRVIKKSITIKPVAAQTNVTMQITDLNNSDLWTYGPFDITIDANGNFEFTISTVLDFKVGEYLVTFLSPDGDVTLYGGISPVSGEHIVYAELPFKPFHDETLHNIKTGGEIVREIEAGENVTAEIVDGKLTISADREDLPENPTFKSVNIDTAGSGNPNFAASIHQDGELHTVIDATRELRINYKDIITGEATTVAGIDNSQAQFLVPIFQGVDPVALKKEIPVIPDLGVFIEKYSTAELEGVNLAYEGKFGDERIYYPVAIYQDVNGWTQLNYTGNMVFKLKNKDTGVLGDKVFELKQSSVTAHKKLEAKNNLDITGDFKAFDTDGNAIFSVIKGDNLAKFSLPVEADTIINLTKTTGINLEVNRGAIRFWATGAIELPFYTDFQDKELVTKEYVDNAISSTPPGGYIGQGLGVPKSIFIGSDEITQSALVGYYINTLNQASIEGRITLNNSAGNTEFRVIINQGARETRDYRVSLGPGNATSQKRIRINEVWECRVYVDWQDGTKSNFFWTRVDDGTASYVESSELASYQQPDSKGFINESVINVDFPLDAIGTQYRPNNVVIMVLKTDSLVNGLNISVVGGDYTGDYNAIGPVYRDEHGEWAQGGKRNAYRINTGDDKYCLFDTSLSAWVLITTDVDHNHTGQQTGGTPINLYNEGQLPASYSSYAITNTLDEIDSEYFKEVFAPITYHENSFVVDFGAHELAGIIFYK